MILELNMILHHIAHIDEKHLAHCADAGFLLCLAEISLKHQKGGQSENRGDIFRQKSRAKKGNQSHSPGNPIAWQAGGPAGLLVHTHSPYKQPNLLIGPGHTLYHYCTVIAMIKISLFYNTLK